MRLKRLKIDGYKNLTEKTVFDFENCTNYAAIIGLNGSGKSNVLEAISKIIHSYSFKNPILDFSFSMEYEKDGKNVKLEDNKVFINDKERKKGVNQFIPTQVIACYSGEETRLWEEVFATPYLKYFNRVKLNYIAQKLQFLYINRFSWSNALLTLLCHNGSIEFIKDLLGIDDPQSEITIQFKFSEKYNDRKTKYSIAETSELTIPQLTDRIKNEQEDQADKKLQLSQISSIDLGNIQNEYQNERWCKQFFEYLFLATMPKTKKLISGINIEFNGKNIPKLSEGEKKLILIRCITQILASEDSLVLLDEPDSHVHLDNKKGIVESIADSNHITFFTTHSPTLTMHCDKHNVFKIENGKVTSASSIYDGIDHLISEDEALKTMFSSKDIIICEGKTDDLYISKALNHFRDEYPTLSFDFLRVGGTDAENIKHLIDKLEISDNKKIIILVDRDQAGLDVYRSLFPDSNTDKKDIDFKTYSDRVEYLMIPPIDNSQTAGVFQIENYFGNAFIRTLAKDFVDSSYTDNNGFSDLSNKLQDKVKLQLRDKINDPANMLGFKVLLDKLKEIKDV